MVFISKDKIFIKNLVLLKGYSCRLIKEFPQKGWNKNGLNVLLRKIQKTRPSWIVSPAVDDHIRCAHQRTLEPGVKVNGEYYGNFLLMEKMLPAISGMSSDFFIFQQDSAPAHRAKDTIALLRREAPSFIGPELWPANSPDLNPVDYRI